MKPKYLRSLARSIVFLAPAASAAPIDTIANGAWNTATPWGSLPASGNDYRIDGENVNSPNATNNQTLTFAGDSLEVTAGQLQLKLEHSDSRTANYNIANFKMSGGSLVFDASNGTSTWNLNSGINFAASTTSKLIIRDGNFATTANFNGAITGSGDIAVESNRSDTNDDRAYFYLKSANSTFSGNWSAQGFDTGAYTNIRAAAANALGTGTVTLLDRGSLLVDVDNGIDSTTGVILSHSAARFNLNNRNWTNAAGVLTLTNGTVNMGSATVSIASMSQAAGTINMSVGGATSGLIAVSGNATFSGGSIAVNVLENPVGKTYDLLTYGGTLTGTPSVTTGDIGRLTASVNNGSGTNDKVTLGFTGSVGNLTWTGSINSNWDNNTTSNFDNSGADVFRNFDNVTFDASATSFTPTLLGNLSASTLTFTGATDYTLAGAGNLVGSTSIVKSGTSTLTIANTTANTYAGDVTITGGTLKAGSATALGAAVVGGGTYISGGGTLDVNGLNLGGELITIEGTGVGGNGAIVNSGASQTQALRFVTLTEDASIGGTGRWDIRGNASAALNLAGHKLTKTGANYIAIVAADVTSGDIDVNEGTLGFSTTTTVNGTGTVKVNSGGNLELGFGSVATNITRDMALNGGTLSSAGSASAANSNISLAGSSSISTAGDLTLNGNLTGTGGFSKTGGSTLTLSGNSDYSGGTIINLGQVTVTSDTAFGTGTVEFQHSTSSTTTTRVNFADVTIANDFVLNTNARTNFRGPINTAAGNTLTTLTGTITVQSNVGNGGHFSSTDGGVLRLTGTINNSGGITPNIRSGVVEMGTTGGNLTQLSQGEGTLRLVANNGIQPTLRLNLAVSSAGTLDLNGFNQTLAELRRHTTHAATVTNGGATPSVLTIDGTVDHEYTGTINDGTGGIAVTKAGSSIWTLSGSSTYSGDTLVEAGTLFVTGALNNSDVTVDANATIGGTGTVGGNLAFDAASFFQIVDLNNPLSVGGAVTFGSGFGIANLLGLDWDALALDSPYTLISSAQTFTASDIANFGLANAAPVGSGRQAYFQDGSLQLVVIPEPGAALLGGIGLLLLLRRRRS